MSRTSAIAAAAALMLSASPRASSAAPGRAPEAHGPAEPGGDAPTDDSSDDEAASPPDDPPGDDAGDLEGDAVAGDAAETEPETARPRRFVWGGTEIEVRSDDEARAPRDAPAAAPEADGRVPGGYLGPTETKEVAPKDGERKLLVAYIVLPLGTLAMVTGAVATWFTHPDHCQQRLGRVGNDINPKQCRGLWILNIVRTTYGSMMIASGAVLLGLGLRERKRYREWTKKHGAFVQPWFQAGPGRGQGGFVLGGRF